MTDTTDIKALREKYELALKDLTERLMECNRLNYCMDEITAFAAFSSTLIDQLESERQRADKVEVKYTEVSGWYVKMKTRMLKAEAELTVLREEKAKWVKYAHLASDEVDRLKGDQVPVAYFAAAPDYGWDMFKNKGDAIAMCQAEIDAYRDCREDGWDDDVQRICWGVVLQKAEGFDQQGVHSSNSHHTYQTCDYSLQPELFTAPQKPILLPQSHYVCGCADRFMSAPEVIAAIEAAGGKVASDHSGDGDDKVGK